ncbi:hypothetical protein Tco_1528366, partial [Tanacetum coccineum]
MTSKPNIPLGAAVHRTKRIPVAAHPFGDEEVVVRGDGVGGVVLSGGAASGVDVVKVVVVDGAVDGGSGGWWRWCGDDVDGCRRL